MRNLYYRDSYGRVRRLSRAEQRISSGSGMPARFFVTVLMALAVIVVIASLTHLLTGVKHQRMRAAARHLDTLRRSSPHCWRRRARKTSSPVTRLSCRASREHARHPGRVLRLSGRSPAGTGRRA